MFVSCHLRTSLRSIRTTTNLSKLTVSRWQSSATAVPDSVEEVELLSESEEVKQANEKQDLVSILKTEDRGWGIYARKNFEVGDLVMSASALKTTSTPDSHSVQTDWNTHVTMDLPARFVNHVCGTATVGIRFNSKGAYDYVAIEDIEEGDEVLWDYTTSEYKVTERFDCACGSPSCRGQMLGFYKHGPQVMEAYGKDSIAPYLFTANPSS